LSILFGAGTELHPSSVAIELQPTHYTDTTRELLQYYLPLPIPTCLVNPELKLYSNSFQLDTECYGETRIDTAPPEIGTLMTHGNKIYIHIYKRERPAGYQPWIKP